jgi:acyl-CoA synthetase (NDP forming)
MPQPTSSSDAIEIEVTRRRYRERYLERGIPVFDTLQGAVRALDRIIRYNEWLARSRHELRSSPR